MQIRFTLVFSLSAFLSVALGCGPSSTDREYETKRATVSHYTPACTGLVVQPCLSVHPDGESWELWYEWPEGFEHEWGNFYRIKYREFERVNPKADQSSIRREVIDVEVRNSVDRRDVFETFELGGAFLANARQKLVERTKPKRVRILAVDKSAECRTENVCDKLIRFDRREEFGWSATLSYSGSQTGSIRILDVEKERPER